MAAAEIKSTIGRASFTLAYVRSFATAEEFIKDTHEMKHLFPKERTAELKRIYALANPVKEKQANITGVDKGKPVKE